VLAVRGGADLSVGAEVLLSAREVKDNKRGGGNAGEGERGYKLGVCARRRFGIIGLFV